MTTGRTSARRGIVAGLAFFTAVVWLPLFPRRSVVRSQSIGGAGDEIDFDWSFESIPAHWDGLRYASDSVVPHIILSLDVLLAGAVAIAVGLLVGRLATPGTEDSHG